MFTAFKSLLLIPVKLLVPSKSSSFTKGSRGKERKDLKRHSERRMEILDLTLRGSLMLTKEGTQIESK